MNRWIPLLLSVALLALPVPSRALLTALTPATASPGDRVTLAGGPFPAGTRIELGGRSLVPELLERDRLVFVVPDLPDGQYLPAIRSGGELWTGPFSLQILEPRPRIESLSPSVVDLCAGDPGRRVEVTGENFLPGATLLLDGAGTAVEEGSPERLVFSLPSLEPGRHELQVVNPRGRASLPRGLTVDSVPEILAVRQGAERVSSYELVIEGKNFLAASTLLVDGRPVLDSPAQPARADRVEYVDCRTLVYHRHPYSRELKRVSLRVVNPGGEQSPIFRVTIP